MTTIGLEIATSVFDLACGDALIQPKTPITSPARKEADKRTR
jgi:hypothetical protein